ncbi:PREDICTED: alpha/beta hydrolase domain-containing protein 11-like [Papilio xuthus]|uniref:sn-1-specific diacylglycerol lipase ABHD11 n=1 Tax=Papilio xuthus TaxID=66420 RepID=A0AAJ6Z8L9_PAPXU|nr:PREDICTED: alpha/beta hydrolase domain-containing protein 11-like [Papilio xuthus]
MLRIVRSCKIYQNVNWLDENIFKCSYKCVRYAVNLSYKVLQQIIGTPSDIAPPLCILHDLLSNKKQWNSIGKTINNLTKRPVVIVDLRNHGMSPHTSSHKYEEMAIDVQNLLKKLSVDKAFFLGHGIGGKTAMCIALLAPKVVAGVMIIDVSPASSPKQFDELYSDIFTIMKKITFKNETKLEATQARIRKELKESLHDDIVMDLIISNVVLKSDLTIGWTCNLDVLIRNFNNMTSFPKRLKGNTYHGPTLFIGGQLSEYLPPDDLPTIRDFFPEAVITYLRSTNHNLHLEDTRGFLEIIIPRLK